MLKTRRLPVIGLTGGIASGKSTVVAILRQLGAFIIDADRIAHDVQRKGQKAWQEIVDHFGNVVLTDDGELDRHALGAIVFSDPLARERLNKIVHPIVIEQIRQQIAAALSYCAPHQGIVVDVPLLYEAKMADMFDQVWVVSVREATQIERLIRRDGLTRSAALARIMAQMPLGDKCRLADRVIDNEEGIDHTRAQVEALWREITIDSDCSTYRPRSKER